VLQWARKHHWAVTLHWNGEALELLLLRTCTNTRMKEIIHRKTNRWLSISRMSLTFEGVEMGAYPPHTLLSDIGVDEGSTLELEALPLEPPDV